MSLTVIRAVPFNAEAPDAALAEAITPAPSAYVRTNFGVPMLPADHQIVIDGAVARPITVTIDALRARVQRTVRATMECAGNDRLDMRPLPVGEPWQHGAVSTLEWSGVSLAELLAEAGVQADAVEVLVTGADRGPRDDAEGDERVHGVRFARSLPLADALRPETLLALAMNGTPLTPDHGAPVRLAVPGWYGMASVKWVTRITVLTAPFTGYFQRQRYVYDDGASVTAVQRMRVKSVIVSPADGAATSRAVTVTGWAWSGDGAIARVEVGLDGGNDWREATLGAAASAHAWTPWSCAVTLPRAGRFVLRSRATDATGATQPDQIHWNRLGYGNNAVRQVVITAD